MSELIENVLNAKEKYSRVEDPLFSDNANYVRLGNLIDLVENVAFLVFDLFLVSISLALILMSLYAIAISSGVAAVVLEPIPFFIVGGLIFFSEAAQRTVRIMFDLIGLVAPAVGLYGRDCKWLNPWVINQNKLIDVL